MVRVEVTAEFFDAGESLYHRTGDEIEVSEDFAANHPHLVDRVDGDDGADSESNDSDSENVGEAFQPEEFLDRNLHEDDGSGVVPDIKDGMVDEFLDEIEEAATRDGTKEAVEERRAELEE
ncbi:hypothetical protein ACFPYI_01920 [Halomarina salina]|uniref:Uncharacterized protein n=1 Tax=Halomarina salina TaxID=1872699 RepID=A0ABD5RIE6_9EURY|nr:hypothetical protein [Halomarina salina]